MRYAPTPVATATDTDTATVTVLTPNIDVNPLSLSSTQATNTSTTLPMTVANTGQGDLNWQIAEEPVAQPPAPLSGGDALVAADVFDGKSSGQPAGAAPELSGWRAPEAVLYDNGPLVTNPGAGAGGADASALQTALGLGTYGFGNQASAGNRVADDFTVGGSGWLISNITFFGYQTGSTTTSTFTAVNLRIWDGPPNVGTSMVVFGDTTTNRLVSSTWSNIYRVLDTGLLDTARPTMANVVAINTFLPAGTYWLDWQAAGSLASGPWAPPVSILGQTGKPGANALQYTTTGWAAVTDPSPGGTPQDFPFIVEGLADCSNLSDVPWLSASPTSGTNTGGTYTPVNVTLNSTGLANGTYTARLCVTSNDPDPRPRQRHRPGDRARDAHGDGRWTAEHRRQPAQPGQHAGAQHDDPANAQRRQHRRQHAQLADRRGHRPGDAGWPGARDAGARRRHDRQPQRHGRWPCAHRLRLRPPTSARASRTSPSCPAGPSRTTRRRWA